MRPYGLVMCKHGLILDTYKVVRSSTHALAFIHTLGHVKHTHTHTDRLQEGWMDRHKDRHRRRDR